MEERRSEVLEKFPPLPGLDTDLRVNPELQPRPSSPLLSTPPLAAPPSLPRPVPLSSTPLRAGKN